MAIRLSQDDFDRQEDRVSHASSIPMADGAAKAVFISYAHADNEGTDRAKRWLDRLKEHLEPLVQQDNITICSDQDIGLGDDWHAHIQTQLNGARAAVLLVSPAFLASKYIRSNELPVLLRNAKERGVKIIPVVLRPCLFEETRFKYPDPRTGPEEFTLASLQAVGSPKRALSEMSEGEQDRALLEVARALAKLVAAEPGASGVTTLRSCRTRGGPRAKVRRPIRSSRTASPCCAICRTGTRSTPASCACGCWTWSAASTRCSSRSNRRTTPTCATCWRTSPGGRWCCWGRRDAASPRCCAGCNWTMRATGLPMAATRFRCSSRSARIRSTRTRRRTRRARWTGWARNGAGWPRTYPDSKRCWRSAASCCCWMR